MKSFVSDQNQMVKNSRVDAFCRRRLLQKKIAATSAMRIITATTEATIAAIGGEFADDEAIMEGELSESKEEGVEGESEDESDPERKEPDEVDPEGEVCELVEPETDVPDEAGAG
jgi:hypothetical protein